MMNNDKEHSQAIEQAKTNFADLRERRENAIGGDALELMREILTPVEIAENNFRVALTGELMRARQEKGISHKKLEELSGVKQSVIARMEKGDMSLQLDTVLKVLVTLGKTLAIVPLEHK